MLTVALAGAASVSATGAAQAASRDAQPGQAPAVRSATVPDASLTAVSADSASDAWAVGSWVNSKNARQSLILHWTGTKWIRVASPNPSHAARYGTYLTGVSADSATDAWAVGYYRYCDCSQRPLILHWDGSTWSKVASPNPGGKGGTHLSGVTALSPTEAWITGYDGLNGVALRWNGSTWTQVPVPSVPEGPQLYGVGADSATDGWMVGQGYSDPYHFSVIMHWDGTAWTRLASPSPQFTETTLAGVSADSATDAWAVGEANGPFILHWDGTAWTQVTSPNPGNSGSLAGVSALSASDAWAAGAYGSYDARHALLLQWDGSSWTQAAIPTPRGTVTGALSGVSAVSASDAWAAGGYRTTGGAGYSFILHWNGSTWAKVPSPSP